MKQSKLLIPTLREIPEEIDSRNYRLLLQAGFIRQVSSGIYMYLPLAVRVIKKIKAIIREEFAEIDGTELQMPTLMPSKLMGLPDDLEDQGTFTTVDQNNQNYVLGSNDIEFFLDLVQTEIHSHKQLPLNLYQIQTNYQDKVYPNSGLMGSREFTSCTSYSFHDSEKSLEDFYRKYEQVYRKILTRCELEFKSVVGDSGLSNGKDTKEFIALSEIGETTICVSNQSDYAANLDRATSLYTGKKSHATYVDLEEVATPNQKSVSELAHFLDVTPQKIIKSLLFIADDEPVLVLMRGDHELNLVKVKNFLGVKKLNPATNEEAENLLGVGLDWIGPVHVSNISIYADNYVADLVNAVAGANQEDAHYLHVNSNRDFEPKAYGDFRLIQEGDPSPDGSGELVFKKGIEVAKLLKVGTDYSENIEATIKNEEGQHTLIQIGSYQLNINRLLAAIVEQNSNEETITWPKAIAPFDLHLLQIDMRDDYQTRLTLEVEEAMRDLGYEVLVDDRKIHSDLKINEADLIGCPIRIMVGQKAFEGIVEVKIKKTGATLEVRKEELANTLSILLTSE